VAATAGSGSGGSSRSTLGPSGVADALTKLEVDLERVITGRVSARELLTRVSYEPPSKRESIEVQIDRHPSARHTVLEVLAEDRPGLLFTVAQTLHELGISVAVAKINTEGGRASDVFYVNEFDGTKLDSESRVRSVRERLLEVLRRPAVMDKPSIAGG